MNEIGAASVGLPQLLVVIPILNILLPWFVAFAGWPITKFKPGA